MKVKLTRITDNPVMAIDEAASNCYNTDIHNPDYTEGQLMRGCMASGHQSVAEFCQLTFHIEGVSRALLAQLTRHRLASFAVRSQRYNSEADFAYVTPKTISNNVEAASWYAETMQMIGEAYRHLQELGVPNEDARFVLPNACATTIEMSMNFREFVHLCNERLCQRAQWEIHDLVKAMVAEVEREAPALAKYCKPKCEVNANYPFCTESKSCKRHPKLSEVYQVKTTSEQTNNT